MNKSVRRCNGGGGGSVHDLLDGAAHIVGDVAGDDAVLAMVGSGQFAGHSMHVDGDDRGQFGRESLREHREDDAGEHISATGSGHGRGARRIEVDLAVGAHDGGVVAFEHDENLIVAGLLDGGAQACLAARLWAEEAVELGVVGSEDREDGYGVEHLGLDGDAIERVGVEHHRLIDRCEEIFERLDGELVGADARADADGIERAVGVYVDDVEFAAVVEVKRLGDSRLQYFVGTLGRAHGELAHSAAQGSARGEDGGSGHAVGAGIKDGRAEIGFGAELLAVVEAHADVALLHEAEAGRGGHVGLHHQADVDHLPLADELGIVGDEEAEARKLDGQGEGGVDGVAVDDMRIPVAEHARGQVDGHHGGILVVDILHEHLESALQLLAEARAEEAVDDQIARIELGHIEGVGDLEEGDLGVLVEQTVALGGTLRRELVASDVEEVDFGSESAVAEQARRGECVGAVVAWSGKYNGGLVGAPA